MVGELLRNRTAVGFCGEQSVMQSASAFGNQFFQFLRVSGISATPTLPLSILVVRAPAHTRSTFSLDITQKEEIDHTKKKRTYGVRIWRDIVYFPPLVPLGIRFTLPSTIDTYAHQNQRDSYFLNTSVICRVQHMNVNNQGYHQFQLLAMSALQISSPFRNTDSGLL